MAGETQIPKGLERSVLLVKVPDENENTTYFMPLDGMINTGGSSVSLFETLRQPVRSDEPVTSVSTITGQTLHTGTFRSGSLPSYGLQVAATPYAPDPENSSNFLRTTAGAVFGQGTGDDAVLTNRQAVDVRAFLYGFNATGSDGKPLRVNDSNELVVTTSATPAAGALLTAADQATAAGSNTSIAAANANRRQIIIQNVDATDAVRIGDTNITTTRGLRLAAGESVTLGDTDLLLTEQIFARAEANTPSVAVTEIEV